MSCKCKKITLAISRDQESATQYVIGLLESAARIMQRIQLHAITRNSCIQCVEKHLGSAAVLLQESANGYPEHLLYAIGDLYQAQVESQEWPELANAIRNARIAFQEKAEMPNFNELYQILITIKNNEAKHENPA